VRATQQDGSYPRPTMCREQWASLDGTWRFAHDDADDGLAQRWFEPSTTAPYDREIEVPYPPESPASGIGDRGLHPVVWYRRTVPHELVAGDDGGHQDSHGGSRVLVHFGAVDYRAQVWVDGRLVASHVGGQTPFTADVTDVLQDVSEHVLVVRAEDDPHDLHQPRGKQDWREKPHSVWYERTTGIWQPVWLEIVPVQHVADVAWTPDVAAGVVRGQITLAKLPTHVFTLDVTLRLGDEVLAEQSYLVRDRVTPLHVEVPALRNGQDRVLVDAEVVLRDRESRAVVDAVDSYLGIRTVSVGGGSFTLNGQPYYTRSVLNQGYRPETHLASRGSAELRGEVEMIKAMGFNAVRMHQKAEDPRFLHWADRLGLLVWGETASAYEFSPTAVALLMSEWLELVRRDRSHPSLVVWVPVNESWGVQDVSTVPAQQAFTRALAQVTRALDPSRPVVSNEGWEHTDSDILGLHDYTTDADELRARYRDRQAALDAALSGHGAQGRRPILGEAQAQAFLAGDAPLMITEFGGISLSDDEESWGYGHVGSLEEYAASLAALFDAVRAGSGVVGFCYTQFMDTGQETNGLVYADGKPKLPVESIAEIVTGTKRRGQVEPTTTFGSTD
jgi:beta-galactosidase/beta-glucuronidase